MHIRLVKVILPILLFTLSTSSASASWQHLDYSFPEKPANFQDQGVVARLYFSDNADLNQLATTLDIWEVNHKAGYLVAMLHPSQLTALNQAGYQVEVDLEQTKRFNQPNQPLPDQVSGIPAFPCYRTVEETYTDLSQLAEDHPNLASWIDIGDSWEKSTPNGVSGYDLHTLILTNSTVQGPKPIFFLLAAIHAREYATAELATRFAEYLVANYDSDPDVTWLLDYYEVHITAVANPDGRKIAETGDLWRKNTDNDDGCFLSFWWGTDLNRNSSFKWGGIGASSFSCDETYRGPSPASEPETQSIQNYVTSSLPDQRGPEDNDPAPEDSSGVFITLHSYGNLVLFPWGWTSGAAPNDTALETLGRKFGFFNNYETCQSGENGCIYQTSGTTDDWAYGEMGLASYTFELGNTFFESCSSFENTIFPENLPALLYAFKSARLPYQNPSGPESINLNLSEDHVAPGDLVTLTATADDIRYDSNGWGDEPVQPIAAARYSLDTPPWVDGASTYPMDPTDTSFDAPVETLAAEIDTTGLNPGRHMIFAESQDADGNWGVPSSAFLWISGDGYLPELDPTIAEGSALIGTSLTYTLQLSNLSTLVDTFDIQLTGNAWETIPSHNSVGPLTPGDSVELEIVVTVPLSAVIGNQDIAILTAVSQGDPSKFATTTLTTTAISAGVFLPIILQ